jgi:hypothetical protein
MATQRVATWHGKCCTVAMAERSTRTEEPHVLQSGLLDQLIQQLASLDRAYRGRVQRADTPCGFLTTLCVAAPRYLTMVPALRDDYARLCNAMAALRLKAARAGEDELDELVSETAAVIAAMDQQEAFERELLFDALREG